MALMVLAFSMLPCADEGPITEGKANTELAQSIPQDNHGDHEDACSPFCICSCCAGFSVATKLPTSTIISIPYQAVHATYISDRLFTIAVPIWQPPRLV